jgi:hypothetical protein
VHSQHQLNSTNCKQHVLELAKSSEVYLMFVYALNPLFKFENMWVPHIICVVPYNHLKCFAY